MIKGFLKWLAGVLFIFFLLFLSLFIFISVITDDEPTIVDNSYLHLRLSGALSEYRAPDPLEEALGQSELDIKKIRDVLEKAWVDERINGVVLQIEFLGTGYAKIQELRHLIKQFQKSGKPIYAYLGPDMAFTRDYYVASACDSIIIPPSTNLFLTGIGSEITFYKDFLKKIGVEAEFVQIGKYKNAPDVYTRKDMSNPHREVLTDLITQYYNDVVQTIAQSRNLQTDRVEELINEISGFTGREALEFGLVDRTGYLSDFEQEFSKNLKKPTRLLGTDYAHVPASSLDIRNKSRIAVINCVGVIAAGSDRDDPYFGKIMGSETLTKNIQRAAKSKSTKAIILRIDSPGGSATASEAIWQAIKKATEQKPVIASISDYGASGGYYIAMAADTMLVTPNSMVGSIGIYAGKFNLSGLYDKLDLRNETIKAGKNAALFSMMQPWTKSERAIMQKLIGDFYQDFVQKTADARGLSFEQVDDLAQGHVWSGKEAAERGLFDGTGYFYSAVEAATQMAGIDSSESVRLVYFPREKSWLSEISSIFSLYANHQNPLQTMEEYFSKIQNKPLALLPFIIRW